jgi:hypothetical protein
VDSDLLVDETGSEWLKNLAQEVVLRVSDGEFEGVDFDHWHDALNFEH